MKDFTLTLMSLALILSTIQCASDNATNLTQTGTLQLKANGEDFVRNGFTSEDGWAITFTSVYANINGATSYQLSETSNTKVQAGKSLPTEVNFHAGHPTTGVAEGTSYVGFTGEHFLSLKQDAFVVDSNSTAVVGNYNRLNFNVKKATSSSKGIVSDYIGYTIVLIGTAVKSGNTVNFTLKFDQETSYTGCGPNGHKGVVTSGGSAESEMTFHFDHIFGNQSEGSATPSDPEKINFVAIGFTPFEQLDASAYPKTLNKTQTEMAAGMANATYVQLVNAITTLGHSGEAHCHY